MSLPHYRPYRNAAAEFQIGIRPMNGDRWLDVSDHAGYMPRKRARLADDLQRYYRSLPQSREAQAELLEIVTAHLLAEHPTLFSLRGRTLHCHIDQTQHELDGSDEPLLILSRFIVEDFVILQEDGGRMGVTAASNPYTSSGRVVSSVGSDIPWAHVPVPGLNDTLGPRIDRILANVRPGVPAERFNWVVTAIGALLFPPEAHAANNAAADEAAQVLADDPALCGEMLWIRTERQTLLRLPRTSAVAFSIHTYSDPLSSIAKDAGSLTGMAAALRSYTAERLRYSAMTGLREPLLAWIEAQLARAESLASGDGSRVSLVDVP